MRIPILYSILIGRFDMQLATSKSEQELRSTSTTDTVLVDAHVFAQPMRLCATPPASYEYPLARVVQEPDVLVHAKPIVKWREQVRLEIDFTCAEERSCNSSIWASVYRPIAATVVHMWTARHFCDQRCTSVAFSAVESSESSALEEVLPAAPPLAPAE